ncbi:MAG: glycosyltransferase [Prevotella sp.]|nr:glycosyltransferase [Prevotella sp.]
MKLSIIIPLYNNEDTLARCLESVLSQDIDHCEIIIVDDGSTDSSGAMADEWAKKHPQIRVLHKPNGGVSDARNHGLDHMKGQYVTFVDSDDTLAPGTLRKLMVMLEKHPEYDILEYSVLQHAGNDDECMLTLNDGVYHHAIDWLSANGCSHCWVWNKIFKSQLFNSLRFPTHLRRFEDMWLINRLLSLHPVIATTSHGHYNYHCNANGLMATIDDYTALLHAQMDIVQHHAINLHDRRWHRLYMDIYNIQLYEYIRSGRILIPGQRVVPRCYNGMASLVKSLALDVLGLKVSCRIFKFFLQLKK